MSVCYVIHQDRHVTIMLYYQQHLEAYAQIAQLPIITFLLTYIIPKVPFPQLKQTRLLKNIHISRV